MSADKDMNSVVGEFSPFFDQVITTRADNPRSASPDLLATLFGASGKSVVASENVHKALDLAQKSAEENDLICVTGSLFVVGEALKIIKKL